MRYRVAAVAVVSTLIMPIAAVEASAASPVRFTWVQYDSPGNDTGTNKSLNAEWVRVKNFGSKARTLTGWTVRDLEGYVFRFPTFKLGAGKTVRIHTGKGANSKTDLYWGKTWYVWNNTGDKAILKNKTGSVVDTCKWGDGDGDTAC